MSVRTRVLAAMLVIAASLIAAGCGSDSASDSSSKSTKSGAESGPTDERLRLVSDFINETFPDPAPDYVEVSYGNAEMLMKPQLGEPEPWLAKSVEMKSDTLWRITLNEGITFQNGKPLDAAALKRWFEWEFKHDEAAKGFLGDPTKIEVVDDLTVDVTLPKFYGPFVYALSNYICAVYDAEAVEAADGKYETLAGKGIFTGPYTYAKSASGSVTYDRYDGYWQGKPSVAGIDARKVKDSNAGLKALANDEADMQMIPAVKLKRASAQYPELKYLVSEEAVTYAAFTPNPSKEPFSDPEVRKAWSFAIDSDAISDPVMDGVWKPLWGIFPSSSDLAVDWREYDPKAAEKTLEDAGWVKGDDGVREKNGARLEAEIVTYTDDLESVGNASIDMLRKVGFDVKLRRLPDYAGLEDLLVKPGPVNVMLLNLENFGLDGNAEATVCRNFEYDKGYNPVIRDDEMNELCQSLLSTTDADKRATEFQQLQELNGERANIIPIVDQPTTMLVNKRYGHLEVNGFYLFIDWKTRPQD